MASGSISLAPLKTEMIIDLSDMTKSLTKIKSDSNAAVADVTKDFSKLEHVSDDVAASGKDMSNDLAKSLNNIAMDANDTASDVSKDYEKMEKAGDELENSGKKTKGTFQKIFDAIKKEASEMSKDVEKSFEKIEKAGEGVKSAGENMTKGVTVPLMAVGAASFKSAMDVESAASKMTAAMGLTKDEAEVMGDIAVKVWRNGWGESLDDVQRAIVNVSQQLKDLNGDELQQATEKALMLEQVFDMDMSETLRGVNALMATYGMTSEQAFDYITVGAQNGLNKTDELGDNLAEYATLFEENGYSADEMFNILQSGLNAGAYNLDKVNDLVKEFGIRMSDGTVKKAAEELGGNFQKIYTQGEKAGKSNKQIFAELSKEISKMKTEQEKAAAISAIFGSQGEDSGTKVIEAMSLASDAYVDVAGAADEAGAAASDNFGTEFQSLLRETATALAPIGQELLGVAREVLPSLIGKIKEVADVIASFPPKLIENIVIFGGVLVAIGPLLMGIGSAMSAAASAGTALAGIATALEISIGALLWPITLVIAGLALLVAAIVTNFGGIRDSLAGVLDSIMGIVQFFIDVFMIYWNEFGTLIMTTAEYAFEFVAAFIDGVCGVVNGIIKVFSSILKGDWEGAWQGVKDILAAAGNALKNMLAAILKAILNYVIGLGIKLWKAAKEAFGNMVEGAKSAWKNLTDWFDRAKEDPVKAIGEIGLSMLNAGSDIINALLDGAKKAWGAVQDWFEDSVQWIKDTVKFWDEESDKVDKKKSKASKDKKDGSHYNGLSYVPFDGYNARLHKGERVLTSEENKAYTQGQVANSDAGGNSRTAPIILQIDGRTFAQIVGDYFDDDNGKKVSFAERGLV
ncbi:phage tail tape measure protein [Listeria marthii]|uniref:phage tail tape measure protein n=1 Tax=Listeria marthii TaxID=529731 RepID=UPI001888D447|nr:phage tail tape measure protein [Listeria marthii]MBF2536433.1 phage tail tape measure protein [Listeria marthii]